MDYWRILFCSLIYLQIEVIFALQRFAEQPRYTEVNPGHDALLICKIIDKRGTCSWQKDNKPVGIYPKKYEWASGSATMGMQSSNIGGDCSLWVRAATLDFDNGLWECQVTASDFTTQDALTSAPVKLVVRVAPQRPRLEYEGVHVQPGHNITVDSGAVATVKCVSHYGNPPAILKWYLGDQEISSLHSQLNATEPDNPRTYSATSVVQIPAVKERHGNMTKCVAIHESYLSRSVAVEAKMDIKYAPTIRLLGAPQIDLEEGKDSLVLRCEADANPPASIVWRRAGRSEIASLQEALQLRPVGRRDAGRYTCQAQNSVGTSEAVSVELDVKYAPRILSAGPDRLTTAPLFTPAAFECVAEGNPLPTYKWVQKISRQGSEYLERGREARLVIDNVTYDYQGEYECRAYNFINGQERSVTSNSIALQVVGAPQVLRSNPPYGHYITVRRGDSAILSMVVCADPRPRHVAWEWGSLRLEAGAGIGRYHVDDVVQDAREDCYLATLHITDADIQDARPYYLVVENERGIDRHSITLRVEGMFSEPLEMSYLLGIAGGCLTAFLLLVCLCIYVIRAKKCCFKSRNNYKTAEKDGDIADMKARTDSAMCPPLDSIYTTATGYHPHGGPHGSPEAMKLRTGSSNDNNDLRNINADLVLGALTKHQRDLFTGTLGIPDVTKHVGSVIHAFETLAMQRNQNPNANPNLVNNAKRQNEPNITFRQYQQHQQQQQPEFDGGASTSPMQQILNINNLRNNHNKINLSTITRPPLSQSQTLYPHHDYTVESLSPNQQQQRRKEQQHQFFLQQNPQSQHKHGQYNQADMNFQTFPKILTKSKVKHNANNPNFYNNNNNNNETASIHIDDGDEDDIMDTDIHNNNDDYRKSSFIKESSSSSSNNNNNNAKLSYQGDTDNPIKNKTKHDYIGKSLHQQQTQPLLRNEYQQAQQQLLQTPQQPHQAHQAHSKGHSRNDNNNDDDFLRGTTVSQSFIKNVKNPTVRKKSTYEQNLNFYANNSSNSNNSNNSNNNFKRDKYSNSSDSKNANRSSSNNNNNNNNNISNNSNSKNLTNNNNIKNSIDADELELRYTQHNRHSNKRKSFQPKTLDRAEL